MKCEWIFNLPLDVIYSVASEYKLPTYLVAAIVYVESSGNSLKARYEKNYMWLHNPQDYYYKLGISEDTEITLQKTSFGLMQVMGATARWLGFDDHLLLLTDKRIGLIWGCEYLKYLNNRYTKINDVISSYNQGSPKKNQDGSYLNQDYVDKVNYHSKILRSLIVS